MGFSTDTSVVEKTRVNEVLPWRVVFYNDDRTTFDLVILILMSIFNKSIDEASEITTRVHVEGRATVGAYDHEIAETKQLEATRIARHYGSPLVITIEK